MQSSMVFCFFVCVFFICKSWSSVKSQMLLFENLKQGFLRGVCFQRKNFEPLLGARGHTRYHHVQSVGFPVCPCSHMKSFSWFISLLCEMCTGVGPLSGARLDHFCLTSDFHPFVSPSCVQTLSWGDASVVPRGTEVTKGTAPVHTSRLHNREPASII